MNVGAVASPAGSAPRLFALALLPLAGVISGTLIDEHDHQGFTNWRSACRASSPSFDSILNFSVELLPTAIAGLLAGALALQLLGFVLRNRRGHAGLCLAAHGGCALAMPASLLLCASALPVSMMLIADLLLTFAASYVVLRTAVPRRR